MTYMRAHAVSKYLDEAYNIQRAVSTLAKLRCIGGGPMFRKLGKAVVYAKADVDAWVKSITTDHGDPLPDPPKPDPFLPP